MTQTEPRLNLDEFHKGRYRDVIGGLWDQIGALQFEFLKRQGLSPDHTLVDIGCGSLRGGVYFVPYLKPGNYYGIDRDSILIEAGKLELAAVGALDRQPHLLVNDAFKLDQFGVKFDFAIAQSVFTHLPLNSIIRCLVETRNVLQPRGKFFATFFEAPYAACLDPLTWASGSVVTYFDRDPYHYSAQEIQGLCQWVGLSVEVIGDWNHPRDQRMLLFQRTS